MLSYETLDAIRFGAEAQRDWVVPIPDADLKDMAGFLTNRLNKQLNYRDYHERRYAHTESAT